MALTERDKIVLGKLRANYYLKPEEGRFYRKRDDRPVKGTQRKKKERYIVMNFSISRGMAIHLRRGGQSVRPYRRRPYEQSY